MSTECSFSLEHYREILQTAQRAGYEFLKFGETAERYCLLRHDIDYTPDKATELGRIEADLGIHATYFFQVVAWTYNVREQTCYRAVQELVEMGHTIALHFDVTWKPGAAWDELPQLCARERTLLADMVDQDIPDLISFHNPGTYADKVVGKPVSGIHHTYEPRYFSDIKYLSDSQGWYEGCVCHLFESTKYPQIQLLTHPYIWWEETRADFVEDMAHMINWRRDQLTEYMVTHNQVCTKNQDRLRVTIKRDGG